MLDYEVAELTWENGQIAMHGLGPPRVSNKLPFTSSSPKYTWEKPLAAGTLESIVNQATFLPHYIPVADDGGGDELVRWFDHHRDAATTVTMDASVPCSSTRGAKEASGQMLEAIGTCVVGSSTCVGSCSGGGNTFENNGDEALKRRRAQMTTTEAAVAAQEWGSRDNSGSGSATFGTDSLQLTLDTCEGKLGVCGFTSTSVGSLENTSSGKRCTVATTTDDHDSVCHSRPQREAEVEKVKKKPAGKSSMSTKRSRAAAVHNQSERKRRDKINQRMKTLQKLVPNSSKTDKASMLDEVIEYLKQLQAQVHMMSRMNMASSSSSSSSSSSMMLPVTLQQQLQLSMMAPMGMGLGMGMGMSCMDINSVGRPNIAGIPPAFLHPAAAFMPLPSCDAAAGDRFSAPPASLFPDPMSTLLAYQSQPMTMDAYSRMAALYQQLHQSPPSVSKHH